jgi:hypothetical protein
MDATVLSLFVIFTKELMRCARWCIEKSSPSCLFVLHPSFSPLLHFGGHISVGVLHKESGFGGMGRIHRTNQVVVKLRRCLGVLRAERPSFSAAIGILHFFVYALLWLRSRGTHTSYTLPELHQQTDGIFYVASARYCRYLPRQYAQCEGTGRT